MYRVMLLIVFLAISLVACTRPIKSFEGNIEEVKANKFIIYCTDEYNKGKKGPINSIGVLCSVDYTNQTVFLDEKGKALTANDFSAGMGVKVVLERSVDIRGSIEKKKDFQLIAKEIVMLNRDDVAN